MTRDAQSKMKIEKLRGALADHQNELLEEGLEETFPASDPVSVVRVE